jgi:Protein of unknown function (DUF551)
MVNNRSAFMNWNPIETAPDDGTYVLVRRASLTSTSDKAIMPPAVARCLKYKRQEGNKHIAEKKWVGVDTGSPVLGRPTHWMPLPAESIAA